MATLTYQRTKITGQVVTFAAASGGGDLVPVNPDGFLLVRNNDATSKTVTIATPGNTRHGQADPDVPVAIAAGAMAMIGPFDATLRDPNDGLVHISYSATTSVTVAAVQV